ncbi:hypothetical protein [Hymenobacter sp. BT491]|uniref:hypothetical protein n=1 Tax=Hymenobacter sp. BT491 TaxID=2766779 RepID=UPI0016536635|nr:hypothetical protein [Hymenobacter sp. BT491]MBC6988995.1 hypothetical protein [Hymenobacter sp. BT491]
MEKKIQEQNLTSVTKDQYTKLLVQCFTPILGKEIKELQRLYGDNVLSDANQMRQIGTEVGAVMAEDCPAYLTLAGMLSSSPSSAAATTGQTVGQLGSLRGTSLAMLQLTVNRAEKADFVWLSKFQGAEELLPKLAALQGKQARISWQEIEVYQPEKKQYTKLREITGIELL